MFGMKTVFVAASLMLAATLSAEAATGILSVRSVVREGPGDHFKPVGHVDAGRFSYGECRLNGQDETWCYVKRDVEPGWIRVVFKEAPKRGGGGSGKAGEGGTGSNSSTTTTTADNGSNPKSRPGPTGNSGNEGISPIDGASLPGSGSSNSTQGDRASWAAAEKEAELNANDPTRK